MLDSHPDLTASVIQGLGWLYMILFLLNSAWTVKSLKEDGEFKSLLGFEHIPRAFLWAFYTAILGLVAITHLTFGRDSDPSEFLIRMPESLKHAIDFVMSDARIFFGLAAVAFWAMIALREWWTKPRVAWMLLNLSLLFLTISMTDYDFRAIVGKPDNVPIVGLLFLVAYFTWLYFYKAIDNDRRIAEGRPLFEKELKEQVLVWPDLVYTEMVCMLLLTAFLIVWGVALQAPIEEPGSAVKTPNPSKAPWYFLGLQEMLVYYDPWMAGVVLPTVILVGLMAVPYIDFNRRGNGYYSFNERKFAVITYLIGFLPLWVALIIVGTFIRGPNWNMFGPYEFWDVHKLEVLNNVNLSEYIWWGIGASVPKPDSTASLLSQTGTILLREWVGIALTIGYLAFLPGLMAVTIFRKFYPRMGFLRYMVLANLVLFMAALPIKMVLRWSFNLKYIVAIPEWFFNI